MGVANAQTPVEVNAHIRYTKSWTEQQRHPVIQAMNKRLNGKMNKACQILWNDYLNHWLVIGKEFIEELKKANQRMVA